MTTELSYDRAGPGGRTPVVLLHAGVADRRMWDPQWPALTADRDTVRLDLRGFGQSDQRPTGPLHPAQDVLDALAALGIDRCHLVGASFGAGVAVEVALARPDLVRSLLLSAPGGALLTDATPDLRAFFAAERAALADGDLDAAVEANLTWWLIGPDRGPDAVAQPIRELVGRMQRRAFEITLDWDDVPEHDAGPPALDQLRTPTLVLLGGHDLDTIRLAAHRPAEQAPDARLLSWPDVAHLPSVERPAEFTELLRDWLTARDSAG